MYLLQQLNTLASADSLGIMMDEHDEMAHIAALKGDELAYIYHREMMGLLQGEMLKRHIYVTGEDVGQMIRSNGFDGLQY